MGGRLGEILLILVVVLLIFGTGKLRNIGTDLGGAIRDFRKSMNDGDKKDVKKPDELAAPPANDKPLDPPSHTG